MVVSHDIQPTGRSFLIQHLIRSASQSPCEMALWGPMGQGPWTRVHGLGPMGQDPWAGAHGRGSMDPDPGRVPGPSLLRRNPHQEAPPAKKTKDFVDF